MYHARQTFEIKLSFVNSTKSLIFDLMKILLPKRLIRTHCLIAKVMLYQILFTELKSIYQLFNYAKVYLGNHLPGIKRCLRYLIHAVSTVVQVANLLSMVYLAERTSLTGFVTFLTGPDLLHRRMEVSRESFFSCSNLQFEFSEFLSSGFLRALTQSPKF